jgi:hypothetical protein
LRLSHAVRFSILDLQFAIERQDGISAVQSQIDNRKSQILSYSARRDTGGQEAVVALGLTIKRGCKQKPHRRHSRAKTRDAWHRGLTGKTGAAGPWRAKLRNVTAQTVPFKGGLEIREVVKKLAASLPTSAVGKICAPLARICQGAACGDEVRRYIHKPTLSQC